MYERATKVLMRLDPRVGRKPLPCDQKRLDIGGFGCGPEPGLGWGLPCPRRRSSTFTSTPSTPSWMGPAGFPPLRLGPEFQMPAVGLTDHGSMAGAIELYREAGKHGVKPLLGCEVYVADDRRAQTKGNAHLTLLAADNTGYGNLIKLASAGFLEGYYYKPRVDWELLSTHSQGLLALSGCLS